METGQEDPEVVKMTDDEDTGRRVGAHVVPMSNDENTLSRMIGSELLAPDSS